MPAVPMSPEGPGHPNETCVECHGVATKLASRHHTGSVSNCGVLVCADSTLCGLTRVYEMMLSTVRSA
jgi:hypothetical protein